MLTFNDARKARATRQRALGFRLDLVAVPLFAAAPARSDGHPPGDPDWHLLRPDVRAGAAAWLGEPAALCRRPPWIGGHRYRDDQRVQPLPDDVRGALEPAGGPAARALSRALLTAEASPL